MKYQIAVPLAALVLFAACGDEDPASQLTVSPSVGAANPITLSVKGSGHTTSIAEGGWRTFTVNATMRADGSVTGNGQYNSRGADVQQWGNAICMHRITTGAGAGWIAIGFEGTKRIGPNPPAPPAATGLPQVTNTDAPYGFFLLVKDNGEGSDAAPDRVTGAVHTLLPGVGAVCAGALDNFAALAIYLTPGAPAYFAAEVESGNIQVRDTE